jgi:hypothetical protein
VTKPDIWYEKDSEGRFVVIANQKGREFIDARSDKPNPWTERWPASDYHCMVISDFVAVASFLSGACNAGLKVGFQCESCPELHRVDVNAAKRLSAIANGEDLEFQDKRIHFKVSPWTRPKQIGHTIRALHDISLGLIGLSELLDESPTADVLAPYINLIEVATNALEAEFPEESPHEEAEFPEESPHEEEHPLRYQAPKGSA